MPDEHRIPVVVAAGQAIERDSMVSPLDLAQRASEAAFSQAPALRARVDRVSVVNILSGGGSAPAAALSNRMRLQPRQTEVSTVGGNSPQWLVNRAAQAISAGELDVVLITGAEAQHSRRQMRANREADHKRRAGSGSRDTASEDQLPPDPLVGDDRPGAGAAELAAGLVLPINVYALFESVIANRAGRDFEQQRAALGDLMSPFSEVAAKHPYAWFPQALTANELAAIGADNRLISEPYPKRMCAVMQVDQGAAVLVTSLASAREAGVEEQAVFCWSGADASDVWFPAARPDLGSSPGIAAAAGTALSASGIAVDDLAAIDLYSCFPCVIEMAIEALGVEHHDSRGLTVTGGLPYFGGPGNNYTLHSIATMVERLRDRGGAGLVTGLGWYATKHSAGIYGSNPPVGGWRTGDTAALQKRIDASALVVVEPPELQSEVEKHPGLEASVVASTVALDRDGVVVAAPVIARLDDGRQLAVAAADEELESLAGRNIVGETVKIAGSQPRYRVEG